METPLKPTAAIVVVALTSLLAGCDTTGGGVRIPARFACDNGARLNLVFDHQKDAAVIKVDKQKTVELPSKHPDGGMWFIGEGYELRGAGDTLNYTTPGQEPVRCVQDR